MERYDPFDNAKFDIIFEYKSMAKWSDANPSIEVKALVEALEELNDIFDENERAFDPERADEIIREALTAFHKSQHSEDCRIFRMDGNCTCKINNSDQTEKAPHDNLRKDP